MAYDEFLDQVDAYVGYLQQTPPTADCERVLAPGERSHREILRRQLEGIWVEPGTWDKIQQLAAG